MYGDRPVSPQILSGPKSDLKVTIKIWGGAKYPPLALLKTLNILPNR